MHITHTTVVESESSTMTQHQCAALTTDALTQRRKYADKLMHAYTRREMGGATGL